MRHNQYDFINDVKLILPYFNNVTHDQMSFRYYGDHLWEDVSAEIKVAIKVAFIYD